MSEDQKRFVPVDLIKLIVDRDTPPDIRNEIVDYSINGIPITRGDVARINQNVS